MQTRRGNTLWDRFKVPTLQQGMGSTLANVLLEKHNYDNQGGDYGCLEEKYIHLSCMVFGMGNSNPVQNRTKETQAKVYLQRAETF